jgi:hypothetical protein
LLYQYKSTNTDAEDAPQAEHKLQWALAGDAAARDSLQERIKKKKQPVSLHRTAELTYKHVLALPKPLTRRRSESACSSTACRYTAELKPGKHMPLFCVKRT